MGRLKQDHDSYKTIGLYKKYQEPKSNNNSKHKSKKDTRNWCKGKVGEEHDKMRVFRKSHYERPIGTRRFIDIVCIKCDKKFFYQHKESERSLPLRIPLDLVIDSAVDIPISIS